MKKITALMSFLLLLSFNSNSQLTKGNWLVGGTGRFSSQRQSGNVIAKSSSIRLTPNVGYFFIDKFAGGTKISLDYYKIKYNGRVSKTTQLGIGPFLRYYFLNVDNRVNLFAESAYQYLHSSGNSGGRDDSHTFTFSAGPVIYFNSGVGIELTANYELLNDSDDPSTVKTFYLSLGFQIHLEPERN